MNIKKMLDNSIFSIKEIAEKYKIKTKKCRYCKQEFIPNSPTQDVCKAPACQRKRLNEKQKKYQKKKRAGLTQCFKSYNIIYMIEKNKFAASFTEKSKEKLSEFSFNIKNISVLFKIKLSDFKIALAKKFQKKQNTYK